MQQSHAVPSVAERPPARASAAGRLANVIIDPLVAFRGVDAHPTWALAFVALVALRFTSVLAFYRPAVSPGKIVAGVLFQLASVAPAVPVLATVLWVVAALWRTSLSWRSSVSVTVHVMFAHTLLTVLIASAAGALLPASVDVDLRNPPFTNLAPLVSPDAPAVARRLLAAADIRTVYALGLIYLGVAAGGAASPDAEVEAHEAGGERRRAAWVVATCLAFHLALAAGTALVRG